MVGSTETEDPTSVHSKINMDSNPDFEDGIDLSAAVEFNRKYDIRNRLGKGLSSVVYVCVEKNTGKELAVKIMDISVNHINADGMDIVQQIHEEIRLLKLVEGHDYINLLVDVFESTTFIFLVFELCQNIDLFDYLSEHVSLSEKRCRAIMKQIFEAVYHCHKVCMHLFNLRLPHVGTTVGGPEGFGIFFKIETLRVSKIRY